jgi:hypothetical protein
VWQADRLKDLGAVADVPGVVCTRPARLAAVVAALIALGCTGPNPAFRPAVRAGDSGAGGIGGPGDARGDRTPDLLVVPDGGGDGLPVPDDSGATPDTLSPPPDAAPDAPLPVDLPPDVPAPPPDLAPDLPPDLPPDLAPAVNLDDHLRAHWQFNEPMGSTQIADRIGNNTGNLSNGASLVPSGIPNAGSGNRAARFQGNDDHMLITNRSLPRLEVTKSIAVWINPDTLTHTGMRTIVAMATSNDSSGIQIGTDGGRPGIWIWGSNAAQVRFNGSWTDRWYHLVYIYESQRHTLYVDGVMVGSAPNLGVSGDANNAVLGCYDATILGSEMYEGLIDDLRVYDKVLSQAEIDRLQQGE